MKFSLKSFSFLLLFTIFFTSCNGQGKTYKNTFAQNEITVYGDSIVGPPSIFEYEFHNGVPYRLKPDPSLQIGEFVRRIFQDRQGNLWFGTNSYGVCRYDGISYKYFSISEGMSGNQITTIMEDREGHLWFSTNGGVSRFNPARENSCGGAFTNYTVNNGLSDNWVWSLFQDSRGTIWAGTNGGLCRFIGTGFIPFSAPLATDSAKSPCSPAFSAFELPQPEVKNPRSRFSTKLVRSIMEDKYGNLWFGTDGLGVCIYDGKSFRHFTKEDGLCGNQIVCMIEDKRGNIWLSSMFGGLSRYDGQTFTNYNVENKSIGDNEVWTIFEDRAGDIWFCAEGYGIYRIRDNSIENFGKKEGLPIEAVQSIFEDREGRFWIGGYGGLYRYTGETFENVTREDGC